MMYLVSMFLAVTLAFCITIVILNLPSFFNK
jgi:hypothetical protein